MECGKCGGTMTPDYMLDLRDDTGTFGFEPWRCMLCGEVTDPIILANREALGLQRDPTPKPKKPRKKSRQKPSGRLVRTG